MYFRMHRFRISQWILNDEDEKGKKKVIYRTGVIIQSTFEGTTKKVSFDQIVTGRIGIPLFLEINLVHKATQYLLQS